MRAAAPPRIGRGHWRFAHPGHPPIPPPTVAYAQSARAIPFELFRGTRIVLAGTVNGAATDMMLDSGAGMTVIDRRSPISLGSRAASRCPCAAPAATSPANHQRSAR